MSNPIELAPDERQLWMMARCASLVAFGLHMKKAVETHDPNMSLAALCDIEADAAILALRERTPKGVIPECMMPQLVEATLEPTTDTLTPADAVAMLEARVKDGRWVASKKSPQRWNGRFNRGDMPQFSAQVEIADGVVSIREPSGTDDPMLVVTSAAVFDAFLTKNEVQPFARKAAP